MKQVSRIFLIGLIVIGVIFLALYPKSYFNPTQPVADKKVLYWIDPMEPQIHYDKPGKSRMGMDVVPVYAEEEMKSGSSLTIAPQLVNNLGVRAAVAKEETITQKITAYGYITFDETKITHLHSYAEGWIKKLFVKAVGEPVKKGQPLIGIFAPKIQLAQSELILSLKFHDKASLENTRTKLRSLNVSEDQIDEIEKDKHIDQLALMLAPHDGVIETLDVREGMGVKPEMTLLGVVDTSTMWVNLEVFPQDGPKLKVGQAVSFSLGGETPMQGTVNYIYPQIDPQTRTFRVRVVVDNPNGLLKSQQFTNGEIIVESKKAITIPKEAVIYGEKTNRVVVQKEVNQFEPRIITLGLHDRGFVEVLSGLKAGEKVITSGQFLIDSEANLKGALERLTPPQETNKEHHHTHGMKMP